MQLYISSTLDGIGLRHVHTFKFCPAIGQILSPAVTFELSSEETWVILLRSTSRKRGCYKWVCHDCFVVNHNVVSFAISNISRIRSDRPLSLCQWKFHSNWLIGWNGPKEVESRLLNDNCSPLNLRVEYQNSGSATKYQVILGLSYIQLAEPKITAFVTWLDHITKRITDTPSLCSPELCVQHLDLL